MTVRRQVDLERYKYPPQPHYPVHQLFADYTGEKLIGKGRGGAVQAWGTFNFFMDLVDPKTNAEDLTVAHFDDYVDYREGAGRMLTTVGRELTTIKAAMRYAVRKNRLSKAVEFEIPEAEGMKRRPLTEEEFREVMKKPMSGRLRKFYYLGYFTGQRPRALEELTWDRVDFKKRAIDFNVPGRRRTNKRRADDFPISDDFLARLIAWKAVAKDAYVIGLGPKGSLSSTFHEAQYVVRVLCGIKDPTLVPRHCLRKMFVTELFSKGENVEVVSYLVRDDPKTLRKHYVTYSPAKMMAVANARTRPEESKR